MVASRHFTVSRAAALAVLLCVTGRTMESQARTEANAPIAAADSIHVVALKAPAAVATYRLVDRHEFDLPTGDVGYTYVDSAEAGNVRLSAFFYRRDSTTLGLAPAAAVARQAELFRQALAIEQARGVFGEYNVPVQGADSVVIGANHVVVQGYQVFVAFRDRAGVHLSYFDVYAVGDGFIKIRYTVPAAGWEQRNYQGIARELVSRAMQGS